MKKTWQIWLLYSLCLLAVAIAMSWLSLKTIRLDALRETDRAETEMARREAELQERVSSALYRMDLKMLPLVAQEAARPEYLYQSFYDVVAPSEQAVLPAKQADENAARLRLPSPLLVKFSDSILLHFQIDVDDKITSPQFPEADERSAAIASHHISESALQQTLARIQQAQQSFSYQSLLQEYAATDRVRIAESANDSKGSDSPLLAYNVPAVEHLRNQIQTEALNPVPINDATKIGMQISRGTLRVNSEFTQRRDSTQEFTQLSVANNSYGYGNAIGYGNSPQRTLQNSSTQFMVEPPQSIPMQPIWLDENLILARRVHSDHRGTMQCCWLNWEKIKVELQDDVAELLPGVQFEALTPETELKVGTALTTIPVQLIVNRQKMLTMLAFDSPSTTTRSALPLSLFAAWCSLVLAAIASALLLRGVLRLSERRAAFVSAVTHELRTPLTTFRMYSEMLADGMVPPEKQQQYASTLKVQADRLSHLVENVLQFARLERGPAKITLETVTVNDLMERIRIRLEERAADSQMRVVFDVEPILSSLPISTQPAAIEQILFNLVDNACKYAQASTDRRIVISIRKPMNRVLFCVQDFGSGIKAADRKRLFQPFQQSDTAIANAVSGVGLGLALCDRMARSIGGRLVNKECSTGALFVLDLPMSEK